MIEVEGPSRSTGEIFSDFESRVDEEMERAAKETEREATRLVPVQSGDLRDSIAADLQKLQVSAGGPEAPYVMSVHEGTAETPPQPFLERAALQAFADAAERMRNG